MAVYSISDLEKLSGVKAHTIRMWEKRYELLNPDRTPTNIRYYQDRDLRLIMNVAILKRQGYKISKIAEMSEQEISRQVQKVSSNGQAEQHQLDALTLALVDLDESQFHRIINQTIEEKGFEATMLEVIYPLLDKLSLLWITGAMKPVQENFISQVIRQKIIVAIDQIPTPKKPKSCFMLFLPTGENQELSMLFFQFIIKKRGFQVINIGNDNSLRDVQDAYSIHKARFLFTLVNDPPEKETLPSWIQQLSAAFPDAQLLLSGYQVSGSGLPAQDNITYLHSLKEAIDYVDGLS